MYSKKKIGFLEAYSIGVGGMVGGGIFAVLGLTITLAGGAAPLSFLLAGLIALLTTYSYIKLSLRYPSEGGTIEFIVQAFGNTIFAGWVNTLLMVSYVIMLALYAYAFGSYGSALIMGHETLWLEQLLIVVVITLFVGINLLGALLTGRAEDIMVFIKLGILIIFSVTCFFTIDPSRLALEHWKSPLAIFTGGLIIFLAYEGFELIANTAADIENPQRNLPRAYIWSVVSVIVLYVVVAVVAVGNLTPEQVIKAKDYALAVAAEPFFGKTGFIVIAIAAMLSTASAINATLYGGGRVTYLIAKYGELPSGFKRKIKNGYEGMIIIGLLAIIFATMFNLENISVAGSFGFLTIFGLVNLANFLLYKETASNRWISLLAFLACLGSVVVLVGYNFLHNPTSLISTSVVVVSTFLFSYLYRVYRDHQPLNEFLDKRLEKREEQRIREAQAVLKYSGPQAKE
jgi:amino acid transporter